MPCANDTEEFRKVLDFAVDHIKKKDLVEGAVEVRYIENPQHQIVSGVNYDFGLVVEYASNQNEKVVFVYFLKYILFHCSINNYFIFQS